MSVISPADGSASGAHGAFRGGRPQPNATFAEYAVPVDADRDFLLKN